MLLSGFSVVAQCGIQDTVIAIPDNETPLEIKILIDGVANNDLSDSNQGVCAVYLNYEHFQRKDLTIDLISPSGQKVTLVGPRDPFNKLPLSGKIEWDISFVKCADAAAPDPGKSDQFDNLDPSWGFGNKYTGVYYPFKGCLEDFNTGPVNGIWTLIVFDHDHFNRGNFLGFTIEFCDGTTVDCNLCKADAGFFSAYSSSFCIDDPDIQLDLNPIFHDFMVPDINLYEYQYIIHENGVLIDITSQPDFDTLGVGLYNICGFSYLKEDSIALFDLLDSLNIDDFIDSIKTPGAPFCADIMDTCYILDIYPVDSLVNLDTAICAGDTLRLLDQNFFESGDYYISSPDNNCEIAYNLHLRVLELDAGISALDTILSCDDNGSILLRGLGFTPGIGINFKWNKTLPAIIGDTTAVLVGQPGQYSFVLTLGQCADTAEINITSQTDFPILDFDLQHIDCIHDSAKISVRSLNTGIDSVVWINSLNKSFYGTDITTIDTGYYLANVYTPGGCLGFEMIKVEKDTFPPFIYVTGNNIDCNNDTAFLHLNSPDSLFSILWNELGYGSKDTFTLFSGEYHVEVTGINGCVSVDSILIEENITPAEYNIDFDTIKCYNDTAYIDFQSDEIINSIKWITPDLDTIVTEDLNVILPGMYYCIIEDGNGCIVKDSVSIIKDVGIPDIQILIPVLYLSCSVDSVRLSFNSSSIIKDIEWTGPGGYFSNDFSPFAYVAGVYTVTITGKNGCKNSGDINVLMDDSAPQVTIIPDTISCIDDTADIMVVYTGNYDFTWIDPDSNILTGNKISSVLNGYYYLTVTDRDNNCSSEFVAFVPVDTIIPDISVIASNDFDCSHNEVRIFLNSNTELKKINWSGDDFIYTGDTAFVNKPGMYYVEAVSTGYCVSNDSIYLDRTEYLDIKPDTFYLNCNNGREVMLELDGAQDTFDFMWQGPSFSSTSPSPVVDVDGLYKVIVNNKDCIDSADIWVFYDTLVPDIDVVYDPVIRCNPDYSVIKVLLDSTLIDTFYMQGPGFTSNKLIDTVYSPGQYIIKTVGKNGCSSSYFINIDLSNEYTEIKAIGDTVNCVTGIHDLILDAGISGEYTQLNWTGPNGFYSNDKRNIVTDTGKYYLVVTNSSGCVTVDSATIIYDIVLPKYRIEYPETITCFNDSVELIINGLDSGLVYDWTGPYGFYSDKNSFFVKSGGDYIVMISGLNGCSVIDTVNVKINKLKPYISLSANNLNCTSSVTSIDLSTNANNYSVIWLGPGAFNSTDNNPLVNTSGMYYVELTDNQNGCSVADSIFIKYDTLKPRIVVDDFYLPCDTTKIKLTAKSSNSRADYYWYGPNSFYAEGDIVYTNIAGKYYVYVIGENGCDTTVNFNVFDIPVNPEFEAYGDNINCENDSVVLRAVGVNDDLSFEWRGPNGYVSYEKEPVVDVPGDYELYVIGKNKCDSSVIVSVLIDTIKPEIEIEYFDSLVCEKQTSILGLNILNSTSSDFYSYYWYSDNGIVTSGKYTENPIIKGEGKYFVDVKDLGNGCKSVDSVFIKSTNYNLDSARIIIISPTCYGYSDGMFFIDTAFGGEHPYSYSLDNYYFSNINQFTSKKAGTYKVYIKDKNGCRLDTTIIVNNGASVQLQLTSDKKEIYPGEKVKLTAHILSDNSIVTYDWQPLFLFDMTDTIIQDIKPLESGEIYLKVIDSLGCYDDDEIWINVLSKPQLYIPDIFSPDHDNINDYFYVKAGKGIKSINKLYIFDRWGERIYEKNDIKLNYPLDGWDGRFKGKDVAPGVYVYYIEYELENGEIEKITGDITLIR
jgi:gliding motility-associated-like protein